MFNMDDDITMIKVRKGTRGKLKQKWTHGNDTYDKVINRLLEETHKEIDTDLPSEKKEALPNA